MTTMFTLDDRSRILGHHAWNLLKQGGYQVDWSGDPRQLPPGALITDAPVYGYRGNLALVVAGSHYCSVQNARLDLRANGAIEVLTSPWLCPPSGAVAVLVPASRAAASAFDQVWTACQQQIQIIQRNERP